MSVRTPANVGLLYALTQAAVGTYLAPTQATDPNVTGIVTQPHPSVAPGLVDQNDETTPFGTGGLPFNGGMYWSWPVTVRATGLGEATGDPEADWLALFRACTFAEDEPTVSDAVTVRFRPTPAYNVPSNNAGNPKVASLTWIDGGAGNASVWRGKDAIGVLTSMEPVDGSIRFAFDFAALFARSAAGVDDMRVARSATSFTMAAAVPLSRAAHPFFADKGAVFAIDGGSDDVAEALANVCVETWSFASGMTLEPQPCTAQEDGYDPAFSVPTGPCGLSLTVSQPAATATVVDPFVAMLREAQGTSVSLTWSKTYDGVTWKLILRIKNFVVQAFADGDSAGKRTSEITLQGFDNDGTGAFELEWQRVEP